MLNRRIDELEERIRSLEEDLLKTPPQIFVYNDLPFALFLYNPKDEYKLRREVKLLKIRLQNNGKKVKIISLSKLFWKFIEDSGGIDYYINLEKTFGYEKAQSTISRFLNKGRKTPPLYEMVKNEIEGLNPDYWIVFMVRASVFAPFIYRTSVLLNELHGKTKVPIVLFFPGKRNLSTEIVFMNIKDRSVNEFNYRLKIYS